MNLKQDLLKAICGGVIVGLLISNVIGELHRKQAYHQYEVQQTCDRARLNTDSQIMETCQALQSKYNVEYICDSKLIGAYCFVEVK